MITNRLAPTSKAPLISPRGLLLPALALLLAWGEPAQGQSPPSTVPTLLNYQGKVAVGATPFTGTGNFKFALVNATGTQTYWSNDGTSFGGGEPDEAVPLPVSNGAYSIQLGDLSKPNMTWVPYYVFNNGDVRLRVWFSDGTNGMQLLSPDQRIVSVGYAMSAASALSVPDGTITAAKLAPGIDLSGNVAAVGGIAVADVAAGAASANAATAANTPGEIVKRDGNGDFTAGTITASTFAGNGSGLTNLPGMAGFSWQVIADVSHQAAPNRGCIFTAEQRCGLTLPPLPAVGDVVRVSGRGGWEILPGSGQTVVFGASDIFEKAVAHPEVASWQDVVSSADGLHLVAVGTYCMAISDDGGETWNPGDSSQPWASVASSDDGSRLVAGTQLGSVFTSTDGGATWTHRLDANLYRSSRVASSADGMKLIAATWDGKVSISSDGGNSWTEKLSAQRWEAVVCSGDGTKMAASYYDGGSGPWFSEDSGATWVQKSAGHGGAIFMAFSADASRLLLYSGAGEVKQSIDFGQTWTPLRSIEHFQDFSISADGNNLMILSNGSIASSEDSGATWQDRRYSRNSPPESGHLFAMSADGTKFVAVQPDGPIFKGTVMSNGAKLTGGRNSSAELVYIGDDTFLTVSTQGDVSLK